MPIWSCLYGHLRHGDLICHSIFLEANRVETRCFCIRVRSGTWVAEVLGVSPLLFIYFRTEKQPTLSASDLPRCWWGLCRCDPCAMAASGGQKSEKLDEAQALARSCAGRPDFLPCDGLSICATHSHGKCFKLHWCCHLGWCHCKYTHLASLRRG